MILNAIVLFLSLFSLRERERERASEQERGRESGKERIRSRLHTVMGLDPKNHEIMT